METARDRAEYFAGLMQAGAYRLGPAGEFQPELIFRGAGLLQTTFADGDVPLEGDREARTAREPDLWTRVDLVIGILVEKIGRRTDWLSVSEGLVGFFSDVDLDGEALEP